MKKTVCLLAFAFYFISVSAQNNNRFTEEEEEVKTEEVEQKSDEEPKPQPTRNSTKTKSTFWQRTRIGGNLGAGFGDFTYINLSPRLYYQATEKLWAGIGFTFIYSNNKYYHAPYNEQYVYGANLFATYQLFGPLFVQAEYEPLRYEQYLYTIDPNGNRIINGEEPAWQHSVLLGGGISQPIGNNGRLFISILYNVTFQNEFDNYYNSPFVFRIGFGI